MTTLFDALNLKQTVRVTYWFHATEALFIARLQRQRVLATPEFGNVPFDPETPVILEGVWAHSKSRG